MELAIGMNASPSTTQNMVASVALCNRVSDKDNDRKSDGRDKTSILVQLSTGLETTYANCSNQQPSVHSNQLPPPPARILTKKAQPMGNGGLDNDDRNLIVRVRDVLGGTSPSQPSYLVLDMLGQGTFGQVFRCQNLHTNEIVAVKVIRNHPSYYKQAIVEVQITSMLNRVYSNESAPHIVRMLSTFEFHNHLCIVFELLSMNIYELISENNFAGFPLEITRGFLEQILHAIIQLEAVGVIHCDLKPENILLVGQGHSFAQRSATPWIKVVDFGSACMENETVYSYIQSRFYRSPEVLLGIPYTGTIDMWSLGCIAVELFLGLPLFPGVSEHDQLRLIEETLGPIPQHVLRRGRNLLKYYKMTHPSFCLKTPQEYAQETNTSIQVSKKYFKYSQLKDMIHAYPSTNSEMEQLQRETFVHFVTGLLCLDPDTRWTAEEAIRHPFITGQPLLFTAHDCRSQSMDLNQQEWSSAPPDSWPYYYEVPYYPIQERKLNAKVTPISFSTLSSNDQRTYHSSRIATTTSSKVAPKISSSVLPLSPTHDYGSPASNHVDWRYSDYDKSMVMYPHSMLYEQPRMWPQPPQHMETNRHRYHRHKRHAKDKDSNTNTNQTESEAHPNAHSTRPRHTTPRRQGCKERHSRFRKSPKRVHTTYPPVQLSANTKTSGKNETAETTVCAVEEQFSAVMTLAVVASAVALPT